MIDIISKRTRNSKTHDLGENRYALDVSIGSLHYQETPGGAWLDIDLNWDVNRQITKALYKATFLEIPGVRFEYKGHWIQAEIVGSGVAGIKDANKVTYSDVFTDTDIILMAGDTSVDFQYSLKSSLAPNTFKLKITSSSKHRQKSKKGFDFGAFYIPDIRCYDANGEDIEISGSIAQAGGGYEITVNLDTTGAVFPITIDPNIFPAGKRYFHDEAWNGYKKWISSEPDGASPSSEYVSSRVVGDVLVLAFQSEQLEVDSIDANHWGFYLWANKTGGESQLFVKVKKIDSNGQLICTTDYTQAVPDAETELYCMVDFPETAWTSGDRICVEVWVHKTVSANGQRIYFYYDHSTRDSRAVDPTVDETVASSADDCWRSVNAGYFSLTHTDLWVGQINTTYKDCGIGHRWQTVDVPQGATIDVAYITYRSIATNPTGYICRSRFYGNDVDDAVTFSDATDFDARVKTTAYVTYDADEVWTLDTDYNSPELKTIVQEIVDRGSWAANNDMAILWLDNLSDLSGQRKLYSYDSSTTYCPRLHIEYTAAGGNPWYAYAQMQ